jgi:hypothetical protein
MPSLSFDHPGGDPPFIVNWSGGWRTLTIRRGGTRIGTLEGRAALLEGRQFALEDESALTVALIDAALTLALNGVELERSPDSTDQMRGAYIFLLVIGGFNLLIGGLAAFRVGWALGLGGTLLSVPLGIVYLSLGWMIRRGSGSAATIALVLYLVESGLTLWFSAESLARLPTGTLFIRLGVLIALVHAVLQFRRQGAG